MVLARQAQLYRDDARKSGTLLTASEREELMKPYLPAPVRPNSPSSRHKARPIRTFIKSQFHILIFTLIHTFYSAYIRLRQAYHAVLHRVSAILYYHHRTPELIQKDVKTLARLPKHLSVILELQSEEQGGESLGVLLDNVAEISAWCASVGIPILSVYEKTGILKNYIPVTHRTIASKLHSYFGRRRPSLQVRAPHMPSFLNGDISEESSNSTDLGHLSLLLLSSEDGRSTMVDLTKTLVEMSQLGKLTPDDVSLDLIDAEISESVTGEPDLLLLFSPTVKLDGYPPWQLRLTEIFHVLDNTGVEYLVWLKGLHKFAKAQMRFGR